MKLRARDNDNSERAVAIWKSLYLNYCRVVSYTNDIIMELYLMSIEIFLVCGIGIVYVIKKLA